MKKSASDLLAGADFSEGPILLCVEIELERFLVGADIHLRVHTQIKMWTFTSFSTVGQSPAFKPPRPWLHPDSLRGVCGNPPAQIVRQLRVKPIAALT